ncbi:hypothetical protein Cni_G08655 [Canna indica]|uniref:C3H1-type domain-containing protein n=1 Tax=Canna indica TaxID=4628 RepID=A0AAQ3K2J3_9LILI|nr:hypothetical protein Cni_G08655 [Canna indica]
MMPDITHNDVSGSSNSSPEKLEEAMWKLKFEDGQEKADGNLSPYPDRPGEPDCLYYLKSGVCGYGSKCKYNHPSNTRKSTQFSGQLPQRDGQPDCQFFLKTGTCKYGATCKYHHPEDKHDKQVIQYNDLGLPIRKDEKLCAYYMKTGTCKFGVACKFNHPQPVAPVTTFPVTGSLPRGYTGFAAPTSGQPLVGGIPPWPLSRISYVSSPHMQGHPPYVPLALPPTQGTVPMQQGWSSYMGSMNHISANMLPPNPVANPKHQAQQRSSMPLNLPERPDQPECQYYMKTGSCKFGTSCKYHHPKERNHAAATTIGPLGLPLNPGQPMCAFYATYGSCKYGTSCKFDHPLAGYYSYTMPSFSYPDQSAFFPNQRNMNVIWTAENSSFKASEFPDQLKKAETKSAQQNTEKNEHGIPSSRPSNTEPHAVSMK